MQAIYIVFSLSFPFLSCKDNKNCELSVMISQLFRTFAEIIDL